ncbi:MAG: hypothetical protein C0601_12485 [Candidatus Muiribacterium halophilum]|uniref:NADPH-dependent FMN reductase-like domain-containing protein n=1 Tax=Muiribacterium halophilum TaxID=2053465 RepID=A0A2N5ZAA0_MUIH1|nr:MAG: hypothetical protein C0601_12485 [Candidatus Muirbacterium halophilum]
MNTIVVYYSLNGNTKMVAEKIAERLGCETSRVTTKKKMPQGKAGQILKGALITLLKARPAIRFEKEISDYDHIIICTPIWAGTFTPAIRSFISLNDMREKKISMVSTFDGGPGRCFKALEEEIKPKEVIATLELKKPASDPELDSKIDSFVGEVKRKA